MNITYYTPLLGLKQSKYLKSQNMLIFSGFGECADF